MTPSDYVQYWRAVDERTSSSRSKIHFGHYKFSAKFERFATFFARKLTFIARTGWAPSRWGIGLTVLLEKIAGA
jgi:hypothetical protein